MPILYTYVHTYMESSTCIRCRLICFSPASQCRVEPVKASWNGMYFIREMKSKYYPLFSLHVHVNRFNVEFCDSLMDGATEDAQRSARHTIARITSTLQGPQTIHRSVVPFRISPVPNEIVLFFFTLSIDLHHTTRSPPHTYHYLGTVKMWQMRSSTRRE